ncbi:MAG: hypothetical protein IAE79_22930 [Anaerolinea sp.]|nr:hypothetical protein [Anaerolinea sp.]
MTSVGYNDQRQLKRLALGNGLTTWYGYHGYEGSGNQDAYDALDGSWSGNGEWTFVFTF